MTIAPYAAGEGYRKIIKPDREQQGLVQNGSPEASERHAQKDSEVLCGCDPLFVKLNLPLEFFFPLNCTVFVKYVVCGNSGMVELYL